MPQKTKHDQKRAFEAEPTKLPAQNRACEAQTPPMKTDYEKIQNDEVEVLRSIFVEEFEDVENKPGAWNKSSEKAFKLHLKASSNADLRLTLSVRLSSTYPKTTPSLTVSENDSLSQRVRTEINGIIQLKPKSLLGTEMIFEIATSIQDVLEDAAQAQVGNEGLPSLEEERMVKEAAADRLLKEQEQVRVRQQEEETVEEERVLDKMVQEERRRQDRLRSSRRSSRPATVDVESLLEPSSELPHRVDFDQTMTVQDNDGNYVSFNAVYGKSRISASRNKELSVVWPVLPGDVQVPQLVLKETILREKPKESDQIKQQLRAAEEKLETLKGCQHAGLVEVFGFKIHRSPNPEAPSSTYWNICVLMEYANKGSLSDLLDVVGTVGVETIRSWMIQLLEAVEFLHAHGLTHSGIHCGNVLLFRSSSGSTNLKLSDAFGLAKTGAADFTTSESPYWSPPELTQKTSAVRGPKADIWEVGVVFLQTAFGKEVLQRYTSSSALIQAMDLTESLEDMLRAIFRPDPKKRPSAFDLLPYEFLRIDTPLLESLNTSTLIPARGSKRSRHDSNGLPMPSRYANDFVEAGRLGKGGFGEVVKARNKLDGHFYAVKKITQTSTAALKDILSEIMLLSRLNHPFVVRYYTAWLEEEYGTNSEENEEAVSTTDDATAQDDMEDLNIKFSTGGLDFISSSGYPKIEFGTDDDNDENDANDDNDDEDSANDDGDSTESKAAPVSKLRSNDSRPIRSTLFIQMEYCEKKTLRDLIKKDLYENEEESWRFFRQISEGLSHIHGLGIIHRDLKPDNIFIDVANIPRIGDFGLATTGQNSSTARSSGTGDTSGLMTRSIGTTFYVAPELTSTVPGNYNEKVDMYSLGIIFFEMCYPLKTGMERVQVLRRLREKERSLPAEFQASGKTQQAGIILSLISHRPSDRPSANELLKKLPMPVEDESLRRALVGLSNSDSPEYHKILSAIFSQPARKAQDYAWDRNPRIAQMEEVLIAGLVKDRLTAIFRRHGAIETPRQMLFPKSEHYNNTGAVQLLEPSGTLLQLAYDGTYPHARAIARQEPDAEKTYAFIQAYREATGEPRNHREADFDSISHNTLDLSLKDAEVIKVLDEIIHEFPPLKSGKMCFHLNHSDLLDTILQYCGIAAPQRPLVKDIISKLNIGQWNWQKIRAELRSPSINISSTSLDDLEKFTWRDTLEKSRERLETLLENTSFVDRIGPIFSRLSAIMAYLGRFHVETKTFINPLSSLNDKFYRGSILFQCLFDGKKREVFAAGGRYDSLISELRAKGGAKRHLDHAVGFNLAWDRLCTSMSNYLRNPGKNFLKHNDIDISGEWKPRRCDVLVASFDSTILRTTGLEVVQELWSKGISAELATDISSTEELTIGYKEDHHSWIVLVRHDSSAIGERSLKIRSMARKEDFDLPMSELIPWLRSEIRERTHREGVADNPKLLRMASQQDQDTLAVGREVDVRILSSRHRGKKTNRRQIIDAAQSRSQELVKSFLDGPIAAIETTDDILDAMRDTRLSDPDSWRTLIQNAPLNERKYLQQVHQLLQDLASEAKDGNRNAFVFNYRTRSCIYYDLGRTA